MASSIAGSIDEAFRGATSNLVRWLERTYGLNAAEVSSVLGTAMVYDVAEVSRSAAARGGEASKVRTLCAQEGWTIKITTATPARDQSSLKAAEPQSDAREPCLRKVKRTASEIP